MVSEGLTPTSAPTQLEVEFRGAVQPGAELGSVHPERISLNQILKGLIDQLDQESPQNPFV